MRDQVGFPCFNLQACTILASVLTTGLNLLASQRFATKLHISPACDLHDETVRFVAIKSEQEFARNIQQPPAIRTLKIQIRVSHVSINSVVGPPLAEMGRSGRPLRLSGALFGDCCVNTFHRAV